MKKIYFLGICGISMSALAIMAKNEGNLVGGCDDGQISEVLQEENICVDKNFDAKKILDADEIVFSSAMRKHESLIFAKKHYKKILSRGEFLGRIAKKYDKVIAVAGSHGKTTTTALVFQILQFAGKNPTLHLGGLRCEDGKNFYLGEKDYFVTEACEYCDNFLFLNPYISVVTNVEKEHLDYFKTFENQKNSFEKFKRNSNFVIDNFADISAKNISHDKSGGLVFSLYNKNKKIMKVHMRICEDVNVKNCIYAYLVAKKLGISDKIIQLAFENFKGVKTRFERVNCPFFDIVICDYAHHPTEIENAVKSANKIFKNRQVITIFQPHTYSRTKTLFDEFFAVFSKVKHSIFYKTYPARENESDGMSAKTFAEIIKKHNKNTQYFDNFTSLKDFLTENFSKDTVLLFVGGGDLPNILHKNHFIS